MIATDLIERLGLGDPREGHARRVIDILEDMERQQLRHLLRLGLLHPYLGHFRQQLLRRHEQRSQYLALADRLLPKRNGQIVVFLIFCRHLAQV